MYVDRNVCTHRNNDEFNKNPDCMLSMAFSACPACASPGLFVVWTWICEKRPLVSGRTLWACSLSKLTIKGNKWIHIHESSISVQCPAVPYESGSCPRTTGTLPKPLPHTCSP